MEQQLYIHNQIFELESGATLNHIDIAYHTYGQLNADKSNVVWIFHALTANANAADWWSGLVGEGKLFNPNEYYIVCANILGSCYGSSGPLAIDNKTKHPYYLNFPIVTIRDMVKAHDLLRTHLKVEKIHIAIGGSMGGYQAMEWAIADPALFEKLVLLATSASESAWGIAIHSAQRMAIEADTTWQDKKQDAGKEGLKAARAIGMLTYRNYNAYKQTQTDTDSNKILNFKAEGYIRYQGEKLVNRFNAQCYYRLTQAMDSHNIARNRTTLDEALNCIKAKTLVIGISSDILCPVTEQQFLAKHIPDGKYVEIDSPFGHDGFLVETEKISVNIRNFLAGS